MDLQLGDNLVQNRQLAINQQVIKALEILEMGNLELCAYLRQQVLDNPVLDIAYEDEYIEDTGDPQLEKLEWLEANNYLDQGAASDCDSKVNLVERIATDTKQTLADYLWEQLSVMKLKPEALSIARHIIGYLDDNGYLEASVPEIAEETNLPAAKIKTALQVVQSLEPYGVAARNLPECLLIQLDNMGYHEQKLRWIITDFLDDLAKNKLSLIAKKTGLSLTEVNRYGSIIKRLNPYPGRAFGGFEKPDYIRPDILIASMDGRFEPFLNEAVYPTLLMGKYYLKVMKSTDDPQVMQYISVKIKEAAWLMKAVRQRKNTLLNVAGTIADIQQSFFTKGVKYLIPMTLSDVAQRLSIHESTVSRAVHGKYLGCARGVYQLKYFFSALANKGGGCSSQAVKAELMEIIRTEDKRRPYSDSQLVELLRARHIVIARRTVAKYREELGVEGTFLRKRLD